MQLRNSILVLFLLICISCLSQGGHQVKVIPQLVLSKKERQSQLGLIVQVINTNTNCYIFTGGYAFGKYLQIAKFDSTNGWIEVIHPSIIEMEERKKIDIQNNTFTNYRRDYNTSSPLFEEWALEDKNFIQGKLQHLDLSLNNEIIDSGAIEKLKGCFASSFSLFFVNRKSVYEQFWNMNFLLNNKGKYRISFVPDTIVKLCEFSFKGFQLASDDKVKFNHTEIVIK